VRKIRSLVTGHRGYIGGNVLTQLEALGHDVRGIDLKEGKNIVCDLDQYENFKPDYIFHLAAIPRVAYSVEFPEEVLENNILSTIRILEFARKSGTKRVIYSSSSSIVGNGDGPTNPYGASKWVPEILCKNYSDVYGLDTVSLRYFNVYSEDQEADGPYATAIANFMHYIRQGKTPFITGDGTQRRDMVHVSDVVSANVFCMDSDIKFGGKWFDVATGFNISLNEVEEIVKEYHPSVEFDRLPDRPGEVQITKGDTLALKKIGWCAKMDINTGIRSCFQKLAKEIKE
jgi:nucleoside-diphosphate-sugar epimerase